MRVLVIEDSERLRRSIAEALRLAGYAVDEEADGKTALWRAGGGEYDLVVLDLMLPGLDGFGILRGLRGKGVATPVIVLTARDAIDDRVRGLDAGADDYLVKPFAVEELLARCRVLLRRGASAGRGALLRVADLEIDTVARVVRRGGETIILPPREWALLELFAHHPGQVMSRTRIEAAIYDDAAEPMSNVVDAAVYGLRRKINRPGLVPLIHTRRGMGYVLHGDDEAAAGKEEA